MIALHFKTNQIAEAMNTINTIEFSAMLNKYAALLREASEKEAQAMTMRSSEIEPHLESLKAKLGLPVGSHKLPSFWKSLEDDRGLVALGLTLQILVKLGIPRICFEVVARILGKNDPDEIFPFLLEVLPVDDFTRN